MKVNKDNIEINHIAFKDGQETHDIYCDCYQALLVTIASTPIADIGFNCFDNSDDAIKNGWSLKNNKFLCPECTKDDKGSMVYVLAGSYDQFRGYIKSNNIKLSECVRVLNCQHIRSITPGIGTFVRVGEWSNIHDWFDIVSIFRDKGVLENLDEH